MTRWNNLISIKNSVIGMIHLKPLPGSPLFDGNLEEVIKFSLADAAALIKGGVHGLMMENFGDVPFSAGQVSGETVAVMTRVAVEIRRLTSLPLGINVLRNDALAAMSIAMASDADFIRVNVLSGARVTDQGLIQGQAFELMRRRKSLGLEKIAVLADVDVKHSAPLAVRPLKDEVEDTILRGLADGVVVSGAGTGKVTDPAKVIEVAKHSSGRPVFLGSGVTTENVKSYSGVATGFIVGSHFKLNGKLEGPVDPDRVRAFVANLK
ncbi:MAG: BtpA/SgcQ family protein [Proteobacteria bacterium]|nr:BtpA/SgcQ family protein [Pseudomonadota bacterium]